MTEKGISIDQLLRALSIGDNVAEAAQILGISTQYCYSLMERWAIQSPHYEDCAIRLEGQLEMLRDGYLTKDVAATYKVSRNYIEKLARQYGIQTFDAEYERLRIAAILVGLKKGETVKDVAARFELAPSTVYYHRKKLKEEV